MTHVTSLMSLKQRIWCKRNLIHHLLKSQKAQEIKAEISLEEIRNLCEITSFWNVTFQLRIGPTIQNPRNLAPTIWTSPFKISHDLNHFQNSLNSPQHLATLPMDPPVHTAQKYFTQIRCQYWYRLWHLVWCTSLWTIYANNNFIALGRVYPSSIEVHFKALYLIGCVRVY